MDILRIVLQLIVAFGLLNVWLLRFQKKTSYRGADADSMRDEFRQYGLPVWVMWIVGALKIGVAIAMLVGVWIGSLVQPAALVLIVLMLGAFAMHLKVKDPIKKALPSLAMLAMAVVLAFL